MPASSTARATLPEPFAWHGDHIGIELGHGARALFTTRRGGVSRPPFDTLNVGRWTDDDREAVEENLDRLLRLVGAGRFGYGRQVHGATVVRDGGDEILEADGQAASRPGVAPIVLTADCLAVALATRGAVAMVHAGWRGLAAGVLEEGVAALRDVARGDGASDAPVVAALGPAARGCCYEVGDEVRAALGLAPAGRPAPIDLPALARERLAAAGVGRIDDVGLCTMCSEPGLFFSHRRDGGRTGRQAGVAWRTS